MEDSKTQIPETRDITLQLDHYDDIFSDFDVRPYSKRALSVDFIDELRRATPDKEKTGIELTLRVPTSLRVEADEAVIKERLAYHFSKHYQNLLREKRKILAGGITMVAFGIIAMIAAAFVDLEYSIKNFYHSILIVLLEPAAWFLLWEGMDQIIFSARKVDPDLEVYRKMADTNGKVVFKSY
jgi:hypothetical protein